jgi:hypothetical protein
LLGDRHLDLLQRAGIGACPSRRLGEGQEHLPGNADRGAKAGLVLPDRAGRGL